MTSRFPAITQVDAYWEGLRRGRLMPARSEVDPRGLEGALEYAMMMEMVAPGVARIRVSGLHLSDLLGMEVRGMPLTAFFEPSDRTRLQDVLKDVVGSPTVAEVALSSPAGIGRPPLTARLYLAPLSADRDGRPRVLACLQSEGKIGRTPRRFTIETVHKRRIVAAAGVTVDPKALAPALQPTPSPAPTPAPARPRAFAEPPTAFEPRRETPERPYLRLVKSDET